MTRILLIGASGLIGQALGVELTKRGYSLNLLSRSRSRAHLSFPCELYTWAGDEAEIPPAALDGISAVINLAGESIAEGRWSRAKKKRLRSSRLGPTQALVRAVAARPKGERPLVVIQGSAIGYYGDTGDRIATESSASGSDFLAQLCVDWEAAAKPLELHGLRLTLLRTGIVLGLEGGALPQLSRLYRLGLGAAPGDGQQWFSWIHLDDLVQLIVHALEDQHVHGPLNGVAPGAVRYEELHRAFTGRPQGPILKAPSPLMHAAVGEGAIMLLASLRVAPTRAEASGFKFRYPDLEAALTALLGTGERRQQDFFKAAQWLPSPFAEVTAFFAEAGNLEAITPPWLNFQVKSSSTPEIQQGTKIRYRLKLHGIPLRWESLISAWTPPKGFVDEQVVGPFKVWHHQHEFEELAGGTLVTDCVHFQVPLGRLGGLTAGWFVEHDVKRIFAYRCKAVAERFAGDQ